MKKLAYALLLISAVVFAQSSAEVAKESLIKLNDNKIDPNREPKPLIASPQEEAQLKTSEIRLTCEFVSQIIDYMLRYHMLYEKYDANLEHRSIDQYLKTLDNSKIYFLASDAEKIKSEMKGFYNRAKKKNCSSLKAAHDLLLKKAQSNYELAQQYLDKSFKLDKKVEITIDTDKRNYPKAETAANDYRKKFLQLQVANFVTTDIPLEEAKTKVLKRYERNANRFKSQREDEIFAEYLDSFARSLDPHSNYLSKDDLEDFEIQMRLSLQGIGATLSSQDGYTVVEQLIKGGAAADSHLIEVQDKIIAVGQGENEVMEDIIDLPLRDVVRKIRGTKGTKVRLLILRKQGDQTKRFNVSLIRKQINLEEEASQVFYVERKDKKKIAIIQLPSFYLDTRDGGRSCYKDTRDLLKEVKKKQVDGLILDLSGNGGGSLDEAVRFAGLFFKKGNVVATKGRKAQVETLDDKDSEINYNGPMVVLTSRLSASASEIVAGALQDYKRAVIVGGDHTFGKGSVQSVVPLPPGLGALKVTIGMFYIPGGNSTQHQGVSADVTLPGVFSTKEIGEKSLDYSLPPKTIKPFISQEAYQNDGPDSWKPIDPSIIPKLKKDSVSRVANEKEFQKITDEIKKAEQKGKVIKISEILNDKEQTKEKEEKRKKSMNDPDFKKEEYLKRLDIQESLNVLSELVDVQKAKPLL